jgi:hypothetical protein
MTKITETERKIGIVASAAQVLRDAHPSHQLAKIECGVARGVWVPDALPVATTNALLLLMDVCGLLALDDAQTQHALSLADWCEAMSLLNTPIQVMPNSNLMAVPIFLPM